MKFRIQPENLLERIALFLNLAPVPLVDTQLAFNAARAIMAGSITGVFESLGKESKTFLQVAEHCGTDPTATKQLMDCLVGIEYLRWNDGQYSLKPKFYKWLLKEYPSNLVGKLRFQMTEWNWMSHLEDYVKTGKPMDMHANLKPEEWADYQDGMRDLSVNTAKELAGKIKLPKGDLKMLDIGGSHGLYSIELCKKNPGLSSTILELPGAIEPAKAIAEKYGLTDAIKYRPGNALADDFPEDQYDLVMINNVVHHFTNEENLQLAKKVYRALKPGGLYAIGEFIRQDKPGKGGAVAATAGLYFAFTSSSGTWSAVEINSWQQEAGLQILKPISLMSLPGWKLMLGKK